MKDNNTEQKTLKIMDKNNYFSFDDMTKITNKLINDVTSWDICDEHATALALCGILYYMRAIANNTYRRYNPDDQNNQHNI